MGVTGRLLTLALMLCVLVVFTPVLQNGFVWDDHRLLDANATGFAQPDAWRKALTSDFWQGADAGRTGADHRLYRPLLKLALIAQFRLFGTEVPSAWHFVSLLLHLVNGALVFGWLRRRVDATVPAELLGVFAGALLFVVHPTRAESVAWLSASSDLWAALFVLLGLTAWDRGRTALATLGFVAALLFKESSAAVPLALAVDALWLAPSAAEQRRRLLRVAIPITAVVATFLGRLLIVPLSDGGSLSNVGIPQERFFATVAQFARMALWPVRPTTQVGYLDSTAFGGNPVYPPALVIAGPIILLALLGIAFVAAHSRPSWRPALADLSWFWILALPALNVIPLAGLQYTGERFLYLPGLGFSALVARGLVDEVRRTDSLRRIAVVGVTFVLVTFGAITRGHTRDFASDLALWSSERLKNPKNGLVLEQLNLAAMDAKQYDLAMTAAVESFALQGPTGKAYMFVQWLRAFAESVKDDPRALKQLRTDADAFAEGGHPVGKSSWLAARIPSEGVEWLRSYSVFTVTRAWLALRTLDYDKAIELAKVAGRSPLSRASAWRCAVITRVAEGKWEAALNMVTDPSAPERWAGLVDKRGNERLSSRVAALYRLNEPSLARRLALDGLNADPHSDELIHLLVQVDLSLKKYTEARRIALQATGQEQWKQRTMEAIGRAEQANLN